MIRTQQQVFKTDSVFNGCEQVQFSTLTTMLESLAPRFFAVTLLGRQTAMFLSASPPVCIVGTLLSSNMNTSVMVFLEILDFEEGLNLA
jgi:hypothetical protein